MLSGARFGFLFSGLFLLVLVSGQLANAQVNGVPASVTSLGFGGSSNPTPGVRASVTSLGPNGFGNGRSAFGQCCANFFLPQNPNLSPFPRHGRNARGRRRDRNLLIGIPEPVYIPYAVAGDEEDFPDESLQAADPRRPMPPEKRAADRRVNSELEAPSDAMVQPAPVPSQPTTVLVFKDGHRSDVINYAIVGDTLFDFGSARTKKILLADLDLAATRKANDDRGVDFLIPGDIGQ